MKEPPQTTSPTTGEFQLSSNYLVTVVLSWLIPGSGHWILGYKLRGTIIAVTLLSLFWTGERVLARNMAVSFEIHPYFFAMQSGNGLSTLSANYFWGEPTRAKSSDRIDRDLPQGIHLGLLFTTISGLLNILVILHIVDPSTWREAAAVKTAGSRSVETESGRPTRS